MRRVVNKAQFEAVGEPQRPCAVGMMRKNSISRASIAERLTVIASSASTRAVIHLAGD